MCSCEHDVANTCAFRVCVKTCFNSSSYRHDEEKSRDGTAGKGGSRFDRGAECENASPITYVLRSKRATVNSLVHVYYVEFKDCTL